MEDLPIFDFLDVELLKFNSDASNLLSLMLMPLLLLLLPEIENQNGGRKKRRRRRGGAGRGRGDTKFGLFVVRPLSATSTTVRLRPACLPQQQHSSSSLSDGRKKTPGSARAKANVPFIATSFFWFVPPPLNHDDKNKTMADQDDNCNTGVEGVTAGVEEVRLDEDGQPLSKSAYKKLLKKEAADKKKAEKAAARVRGACSRCRICRARN